MNKLYLPNLTALRGIAALLVATLHFHFFLGPVVPYGHSVLIDKFYLMVDLFFILSGFIICYVYADTFAGGVSKRAYTSFLLARLARIYPLHVCALAGEFLIFLFISVSGKFAILAAGNQHLYRLDAIPVQLTFLQTVGIYNFDTWNAPAWSLSAEWWAYVLFPVLFLCCRQLGCARWFIVSALAVAGWVLIEWYLAPLEPFLDRGPNPAHHSLDVNWHYGTLRGLCGFIAGISVWMLYQQSTFKAVLANVWVIAALALAAVLSMQFTDYDTLAAIVLAALVLALAYGSPSVDRLFASGALQAIGRWSFSIYMWHMVLIHVILLPFILQRSEPIRGLLRPLKQGHYENVFYLIVFLTCTCFVGYCSYRFIESPSRRWLRSRFAISH